MTYTIKNSFLTVVISDHGAQLRSILGANGVEYLWQGDPAYWPDRDLTLFPYVARLTGGSYELDGKTYRMSIHGLAPYLDFSPIQRGTERLVLELTSTPETMRAYPREFAFRVIYALAENVLNITYEVENRDGRTMYFGLGGHPGFRVPWREGDRFEDCRLRFEAGVAPRRVGFTADCFTDGTDSPFPLTEGALPLAHSLFDEDAIVLKGAGHRVCLEGPEGAPGVTVSFPGMDYLGIWHMPRTDAPYVCVEPWCSLPSAAGERTVFEEKKDLLTLEPGGLYQNTWQISIETLKA